MSFYTRTAIFKMPVVHAAAVGGARARSSAPPDHIETDERNRNVDRHNARAAEHAARVAASNTQGDAYERARATHTANERAHGSDSASTHHLEGQRTRLNQDATRQNTQADHLDAGARRLDAADRRAQEEQQAAGSAHGRTWVRGFYREMARGNRVWVRGHYR